MSKVRRDTKQIKKALSVVRKCVANICDVNKGRLLWCKEDAVVPGVDDRLGLLLFEDQGMRQLWLDSSGRFWLGALSRNPSHESPKSIAMRYGFYRVLMAFSSWMTLFKTRLQMRNKALEDDLAGAKEIWGELNTKVDEILTVIKAREARRSSWLVSPVEFDGPLLVGLTARLSVAFVFAASEGSAAAVLAKETGFMAHEFMSIKVLELLKGSVFPLREPERGRMTLDALEEDARLRQLEEHVVWLGPWFKDAERPRTPAPTVLVPTIPALFDLAALALQFGRTNRITYHEDGVTPESDTDHTVMLGLCACAFAEQFAPHLDRGLIAQFAIVHDLAEALCGDTNTLRIDQAGRDEKEQREQTARQEIRRRFSVLLPWVCETLDRYERLEDPEARFIKVLDKVLPKITHALNGGAALREHGIDLAKLAEVNGSQREAIARSYGADQEAAVALLFAVHEELVRRLAETQIG